MIDVKATRRLQAASDAKADPGVQMNPNFFRTPSLMPQTRMNFIFQQGGLGDYVGYMAAIVFIAKNSPHILGRLYCKEWFIPLAKSFLAKAGVIHWKVLDRGFLEENDLRNQPFFAPSQTPINRLGAHSVDLGFIYFNNTTALEGEDFYPELMQYDLNLPVPRHYAVMTPGASNKPKTMRPHAFNKIKEHLIGKGLTPVFLGDKHFDEKATTAYDEEYDYSGGEDLRGKTNLIEAARILAQARIVVGLDNGLLHLAACSKVDIVYGYTLSSVAHTKPRRKVGRTFDVIPTRKELPCIGCQSNMRHMYSYDFKDCIYGDTMCTQLLDEPERWLKAIDEALAT